MSDPTPETLRRIPLLQDIKALGAALDAHADAWEASISLRKEVEKVAREETADLRKRLEEAGRGLWLAISEWSTWKDVLLSNMKEADWQETMDGLRAAAPKEG